MLCNMIEDTISENAGLPKVRQIWNDFFKSTFLPKNERTNSTLLLVNLSTCLRLFFLEESEDTKNTFLNQLTISRRVSRCTGFCKQTQETKMSQILFTLLLTPPWHTLALYLWFWLASTMIYFDDAFEPWGCFKAW